MFYMLGLVGVTVLVCWWLSREQVAREAERRQAMARQADDLLEEIGYLRDVIVVERRTGELRAKSYQERIAALRSQELKPRPAPRKVDDAAASEVDPRACCSTPRPTSG